MKFRQLLLTAIVFAAAWLAFFSDKSPQSSVVEATERKNKFVPANTKSSISSKKQEADLDVLSLTALQPRSSFIGNSNSTTAHNTLFSQKNWSPPLSTSIQSLPTEVPVVPSLPFTYIGKKFESGIWEVYLSEGDQAFVIREKDTIDERYRVEKISPPTLYLTYLPLKQTQTLSIGVFD